MVGHRIGAERRFGVGRHQIPHLELVPVGAELRVDVHVGELDRIVLRDVDLDVAARTEIEVFTLGQFHDELLDKGRNVAVRDHLALPLLDAEHGFGNVDFQVLLHLDLTPQTPMILGHFTRNEARFGRQDVAAAFEHLAFAHAARTAAAAGGRQKDVVVGERYEQRRTALGGQHLLAVVDVDRHVARRRELRLRIEKQPHQNERHRQKGYDRDYNR